MRLRAQACLAHNEVTLCCGHRRMCQLLGMNSVKPARLSFSLEGFLRRGGETGEHADGWGIALYESMGCRVWVEEQASARSQLAEQLRRTCLPSRNVIVHIRKATQGAINTSNCHPFVRQLWGRDWSFAHNGNLNLATLPSPQRFQPQGDTDSERAFCLLLDRLYAHFGTRMPDISKVHAVLQEGSEEIARAGTFNFILSDGESLFAHRSTQLYYVTRAYPFSKAHLLDYPLGIDFALHNQADDRMVVVATEPLTDENWQSFPVGGVVAFVHGCRRDLVKNRNVPIVAAIGDKAYGVAAPAKTGAQKASGMT